MTRRTFLLATGSAALASAMPTRILGEPNPRMQWQQTPLQPGELKLGDDLLGNRFRLNTRRTFAIPINDLLLPFFRAKGLSNGGKELNGKYAPKVQTGIWPGLYSTFWMCGAAHTAKWSGDPAHKEILARFIHELARTREPDGFLLALGRDPKARWAHGDLYALVRSMVRGLLDIYETTGEKIALELARGQMDCLYHDLADHGGPGTGIALKGMEGKPPVKSYYKLLPALSQLYLHTGDRRYLELADRCIDLPMIEDLITGRRDPLPGRHASTWVDSLLGVYQIGLATDNPRYIQAPLKAWRLIGDQHLFITGSMSSSEAFRDPTLAWQWNGSRQAQETCCAGIWVAFLQNLLHGTGDFAKADSIEQVAYNDLFAAQDPEHGDFCYFLNLEGQDKPFDPPPTHGYHCCDGNGLMGIGRLPGLIYGKTRDGIAINLYAASEATTRVAGAKLKISQTTDYPVNGTVTIRVDPERPVHFALRFRIPFWTYTRGMNLATSPARPEGPSSLSVRVNGERVDSPGLIEREWKAGDTVTLSMSMGPSVVRETRLEVPKIALRWGPVVLAGTWKDDLPVRKSREVPAWGTRSAADIWPATPSLAVSAKPETAFHPVEGNPVTYEAEAVQAADPPAESSGTETSTQTTEAKRVRVRFIPFYNVTQGKYSVWFPTVEKG